MRKHKESCAVCNGSENLGTAPEWGFAGEQEAGDGSFDGRVCGFSAGLPSIHNERQALPRLRIGQAGIGAPHHPFPHLRHPAHEAHDGRPDSEGMHAALKGAGLGVGVDSQPKMALPGCCLEDLHAQRHGFRPVQVSLTRRMHWGSERMASQKWPCWMAL